MRMRSPVQDDEKDEDQEQAEDWGGEKGWPT
jgi:hypothetical protein